MSNSKIRYRRRRRRARALRQLEAKKRLVSAFADVLRRPLLTRDVGYLFPGLHR